MGCLVAGLILVFVMLPIGAALVTFGVRRYLATAKTAEAKMNIGAISRAVVASFERDKRLCGSSLPVPTDVPRSTSYTPRSEPGKDFATGDSANGWTCLKFSLTQPMRYQYTYAKGVGTVPGSGATPSGFEVSAHGDLDGNGVTSTFARSGDVRNGAVVLSMDLFIAGEFE